MFIKHKSSASFLMCRLLVEVNAASGGWGLNPAMFGPHECNTWLRLCGYVSIPEKLVPCGTQGRLLRTPPPPGEWYCNSKSMCKLNRDPFKLESRDTKTRTDIKNLVHTKVRYYSVVSESVVTCQLTLKMAEEIDFEIEIE